VWAEEVNFWSAGVGAWRDEQKLVVVEEQKVAPVIKLRINKAMEGSSAALSCEPRHGLCWPFRVSTRPPASLLRNMQHFSIALMNIVHGPLQQSLGRCH
jgi:hypothetical protein